VCAQKSAGGEDPGTGKVRVHNYRVAADPGLAVQPENVLAELGKPPWRQASGAAPTIAP